MVATLTDLQDERLPSCASRCPATSTSSPTWRRVRTWKRRHGTPSRRWARATAATLARNVEERASYVLEEEGRLVFKADLSARCPIGAQIVGVFTEPDRRGQGLARRGVGEIVRRLHAEGHAGGLPVLCARTTRRRGARTSARGFVPSMHYRRLFVEPASVRSAAKPRKVAT
jgi:GNAT superfamily N-acetyltransferase